MLRYVFRRLLTAIPTLFVIVTMAFFLMRVAPGGPFNQERGLSPEIRANLEAQFGLNDPLWLQFVHYLGNLLRGNFGPSYNMPDFTVTELFAKGLPISVQLGASGMTAGPATAAYTPPRPSPTIEAARSWCARRLASTARSRRAGRAQDSRPRTPPRDDVRRRQACAGGSGRALSPASRAGRPPR